MLKAGRKIITTIQCFAVSVQGSHDVIAELEWRRWSGVKPSRLANVLLVDGTNVNQSAAGKEGIVLVV